MLALVIGGAGFIGHNLVKRLKIEGHRVEVIDLKDPPEPVADLYLKVDASKCRIGNYGRIYQLAANMGGAGFVFTGENDADILNSLGINLNVLSQLKDFQGTIFFSSSVCVYPIGKSKELEAYPANPPSDYGWEKLTSERLYQAYARNYGLEVRIARFHNTYGPYGVYEGGREKSPAAIIRKVIQAKDEIEVWGDGKQVRPFVYIDDLLDGIEILMNNLYNGPVNLGPTEGVSINELTDIVMKIAGKQLTKKYVPGPTGEQIRGSSNELAKSLGWEAKITLEEGLKKTYDWINGKVVS